MPPTSFPRRWCGCWVGRPTRSPEYPRGTIAFELALLNEYYLAENLPETRHVTRTPATNGGVDWSVSFTSGSGQATLTWNVGAEGVLTGFTGDTGGTDFAVPIDSWSISFTRLAAADPIPAPDAESPVDPSVENLPSELPLDP